MGPFIPMEALKHLNPFEAKFQESFFPDMINTLFFSLMTAALLVVPDPECSAYCCYAQ